LCKRLGHPTLHPGVGIESFLRGIEFVHDQQRLAIFFLEGQIALGRPRRGEARSAE
jgi:hypothetical protein